ncbi:MAG: hypothetical protein OK441_03725 [Thaumarchaeota archaeon]|nr:hypothetical protein [Nitrososphaerota archaeon]
MNLKSIYGLLVIATVAWLLIIGESYFFIAVVRPLGPPLHLADLPSTVLKVLITAGLGFLWVGVMFVMDSLHSRFTKTPTSAS